MKVAVYIRKRGSRNYEKASPRKDYSTEAIFCLRYTVDGIRKYETLPVHNYAQANIAAQKKSVDLQIEAVHRKWKPAPTPKPAAPSAPHPSPTDDIMLDAAIDRYLLNVETKSSKTSSGYRYTLQQFYASSGNLVLANVTTQHLYDFVGYLRREDLADRTIHNRVGEVVTFLRHFGIKEVTMKTDVDPADAERKLNSTLVWRYWIRNIALVLLVSAFVMLLPQVWAGLPPKK